MIFIFKGKTKRKGNNTARINKTFDHKLQNKSLVN